MAEQPQGVRQSEKVRGKDIEGKVRVLEKTYPQQLMLFQTFLPEYASDDKYSNTIELYDAIPKYVTNPKLVDAMREGGKYLPLKILQESQNEGHLGGQTAAPGDRRKRRAAGGDAGGRFLG